MAIEAAARVAHRGAASTDLSGDGAGFLTQIPHRLFYRDSYRLGLHLQPGTSLRRGRVLPAVCRGGAGRVDHDDRDRARRRRHPGAGLAGRAGESGGAGAHGPSLVSRHPTGAGGPAGAAPPTRTPGSALSIWHGGRWNGAAEESALPGFYVCSLSSRTIVYKALLTGTQLPAFFTDFRYPEYESAIAVFHQRYSTNTLPSWALAQPFRLLAHNGEINTLWGNRNAMTMRQPMLASPLFGSKIERLQEVIWKEGSDSASLDNAMELLVRPAATWCTPR